MKAPLPFVKLPSDWIEKNGLSLFRWTDGSDQTAALMTLMAVAHRASVKDGVAYLTYDDICAATGVSRSKVSNGLEILTERQIIEKEPDGRSSYRLAGFDPDAGWAKLPARGLYLGDAISALQGFKLRLRAELDALKMYFLFASRRDRRSNMAHLTYEQIAERSGVRQEFIRSGLTVLGACGLVHIDRLERDAGQAGRSSGYRLVHLEPHQHMGTNGRKPEPQEVTFDTYQP